MGELGSRSLSSAVPLTTANCATGSSSSFNLPVESVRDRRPASVAMARAFHECSHRRACPHRVAHDGLSGHPISRNRPVTAT